MTKAVESPFDESQEHSLADFIRLSMTNTIVPKNLPEGMRPDEAASKLTREDIRLRGLGINNHYFSGWFETPRVVETIDGEKLMQYTPAKWPERHFELTLFPGALKLLGIPVAK